MHKERRRVLIAELIRNGGMRSQSQITKALAKSGDKVTQATVSRDLVAIGAVRGPHGYEMPGGARETTGAGTWSESEASRLLSSHLLGVTRAHSLVIVRTAPGHAQMVASVFDRYPPDGVLGTVAGDDTIFLATSSPKSASGVADDLDRLIRGETG